MILNSWARAVEKREEAPQFLMNTGHLKKRNLTGGGAGPCIYSGGGE